MGDSIMDHETEQNFIEVNARLDEIELRLDALESAAEPTARKGTATKKSASTFTDAVEET